MELLITPLSNTEHKTEAIRDELPQSLERYLTAILRMEKRYSVARVKDIANDLGFKKGSVVGALKRLDAMGLIDYPPYRPVQLTDKGHRLAEYIEWRNGVLERFFIAALYMESNEAKVLAGRIGHALKDDVIERMRRFIVEETETCFLQR